MTTIAPLASTLNGSPDTLLQRLSTHLQPGENVHSWLLVDLNEELNFGAALVALSGQRLLWLDSNGEVSSWKLTPGLTLRHGDHAGVGSLALHDASARLARWRFTLRQNRQALALVGAFEREQQRLATGVTPEEEEDGEADFAAESAAPPSTWVLLRLWRFARPYKAKLMLGFLLTLASTAANLVPPYLTIPLMDEVLIPFQNGRQIDPLFVLSLLGGLLMAALLAWGLSWWRTWVLSVVSERIAADMRTASFEHLLTLSLDYFGSKRTGNLMSRIGSETDRISVFLSLHALDFFTDVLMVLMTATILFSINPALALVTLLPLPFIAWTILVVRARLRMGFEKIDRAWSDVTSVLADTIPGIRVVKAFAQERREALRFRAANQQNLEVNDRLNRTWSLFSPTVSLLTDTGLLVVWGFGVWLVSRGEITVGVLSAFIAYIGRFYTRLDSLSRIVSHTQQAAAGAKRVFDILDHVSNVPEPAQPLPVGTPDPAGGEPRLQGRIEMRQLGFRYGSRTVLRGLNLTLEPGEMVGLVGHSGSGKSTLVNLICRFYDVTDGAILVDGTDLRRFRVADYRRHIGLVLQEPYLFFGTIAENIAYGRPDATREHIIAAARAAHAHEFILRLPLGYDSLVGERGQGLSGGERQRISIARALLIDPRILILDEATSSVDTETEQEIQKALDNLVQGRTTIAIAHRLSTLRKADRLIVMDRGQVVEQGPHDELMAQQGAYFRLYEAQARRVDAEETSLIGELARSQQAAASAAHTSAHAPQSN
ncbi:MAG: ABC transporter ATP-binding protein [Leptothrix sp. (in: Bacteria)]|jgi:ATP-binding cassette subfamily B protein|nr:ABC transporter ATP-binding protein [Leptothrix sp. (in: b-proteobacteria)]